MVDPTKSPAFNPTVWLSLAAFLTLLWQFARYRHTADGRTDARIVLRRLLSTPVVFGVGVVSLALPGFSVYMSYAAPRDIAADIVSARRILHGESAYPQDLSVLIQSSLRDEPARWSLGKYFPELADKERREGQTYLKYQPHPPLLVLLTVPLVALTGIHETALLVDLFSLLAFAFTIMLIRKGFDVHISGIAGLALLSATLSWSPVLSLLRQSQSGFFIAALVVLAWYLLRRNLVVAAGIPLGIATCLKLFPGLLLVYLLLRYRRGLLGAVPTMIALALLPVPWMGWQVYLDVSHTTSSAMEMYGVQNHDISLLAMFQKNGVAVSPHALLAIGAVLVAAAAWLVTRTRGTPSQALFDLEYSLFIVLMVLLSPIAWDHYLVLLLLPLFVLGERAFRSDPSWSGMFCCVGVALVLSVSMDTYVLPMTVQKLSHLIHVRIASLPTIALMVLAGWTARALPRLNPSKLGTGVWTGRYSRPSVDA